MTKIYSFLAAALVSVSVMAAVGPQSVQVTFDGTDNANWSVGQSSTYEVKNGLLTVSKMGVQNADQKKYRADVVFSSTSSPYNFCRAKDRVLAIKFMSDIPGTGTKLTPDVVFNDTNKSFNIAVVAAEHGDTLRCADGGKIYYFDLESRKKITDLIADKTYQIKTLQFKIADGVFESADEAKYAVDWVATFASVDDLRAFQDWDDEQTDATLPYYEVLYRTQNGTSFNSGYPKNGFTSVEFEGNYRAGIFAVEYFLVENFDASKSYELKLTNSQAANKDSLAVWDFPYQTTTKTTAADIYAKATEVVGFAPGDSAACKAPIAEAKVDNSVWTLTVPGAKLTALATVNTKTLVGLFITNKQCATKDKKAKFATASHETADAPSFTVIEEGPATAIDQTTSDKRQTTNKVIRNGQVLIIRDGVEFNILGQIVK